ncbi:TonB-dependent receptor plug domain-containing protein [Maribacter arcticus]|uniref:TonB-dependent receptor plug domain-containing protein n=1 Tax=Maribacter arcticus TaxID=561365 RepID=UPI0030039479
MINLNEAGDYNSISTYNLKNTHPLIIIDGQESTENKMKKLPVNNIRTITILKDEAAVKKYGEQGNNGVIEVITNKN